MRVERARGFTLLEVLVALLVLALALLALSRSATQQVAAQQQRRERAIAGWLASDVLAELQLRSAFPATGRSDGERRFGERNWRYEVLVQATPVASIRRIEVSVRAAGESGAPMATLTGFASTDLLQ